MTGVDLDVRVTEDEFGLMVGVSQQGVSRLIVKGVLAPGATAGEWLRSYLTRLREQADDRLGDGALSLPQERALLARAQRRGIEIRNVRLCSEFAPVELLADVLAAASSGLVDRFAELDAQIALACPDLPDDALAVVRRVIDSARGEWLRSTAQLQQVDDGPDTDPDAEESPAEGAQLDDTAED